MQIDYIRRDVPEEISEEGGAFIQIVNKSTLGLTTSIEEAKSTLHVVGAAPMIEGYFVGIMRSVFEGIRLDGHPRTVGDITFFPVCGGTFDLDKGWDPLVNDVRIKARLVNGVTIDVSDWTFRDVTTGRVAYSIDTISDGTTAGIVSTSKDVELNGRNFPAKGLLTVSWVCGTKSGTVASDKFTANVARITIDKSAFSSLTSSEDGEEIVFTVKGCYNKATKSAIVKYVPAPVMTKVVDNNHLESATDYFQQNETVANIVGSNLNWSGAAVTVEYFELEEWKTLAATVNSVSDTKIVATLSTAPSELATTQLRFTVTHEGGTATRTFSVAP